jgi:ELWxxDGT repeat protein
MSSWSSGSSLVVLLCLASFPAAGQTASLLRDINTGRPSRLSSDPAGLHAVRGKVFFTAREPGTGTEMWVSDSSGSGTELLADTCPGDCSGSPDGLGSLGGTFLWATEKEIWRSDGTRAGTYSLNPPESGIDLFEANDFSARELRYALTGQALLLRACTDDLGCELWSTDGTREGTRLVKDVAPGRAGSNIQTMIGAGGKVFFVGNDASFQRFLWVTDGTAAGTIALRQIGFTPLRSLAAQGSRIFFLCSTPEEGEELWTSDGTLNGTRPLTQLAPAQPFSSPDDFEDPRLMPAGGKVYFEADDGMHGRELWASDGTPAGTRRITDFDYDRPFPSTEIAPFVAEVEGDRVVFVATDGVTLHKLWTTRGTAETLASLPDPCKGACRFLPSDFPRLFEVGPRVLFVANDGPHGQELWATDGTAAGTRMIRDLCPGTCSPFFISDFLPLPGMLVFTGSPTLSPRNFPEVWSSDGTAEGTVQLSHDRFSRVDDAVLAGRNLFLARGELWVSTDGSEPRLVTDIDRGEPSSDPAGFTAFHERVYFTAGDDFEREIWQTDGTREGTVQLTTEPDGGAFGSTPVTDPVAAGAYLFYVRNHNSTGGELWRTDGTVAGTIPLVQESLQDRLARPPTAFQDKVYFFATAENLGHHELWRSDGTPAGTAKVLELADELYPEALTAVGQDLYFTAERFGTSRGIWRLDGGTGVVAQVGEVPWFPNDDPRFTRVGSRVFFLARNRLWVTDGTSAGTAPVLPEGGPPATDLAELGGKLYFRSFAKELWQSNGTAAGTVLVKLFPGPLPIGYEAPRLLSAGGRLWLSAHDGVHGIEPWVSDGTAEGTRLLRDVFPGGESSHPHDFAAAGGRVFFAALDALHGEELWQSDGTEAGTRLVQDIAPGLLSSAPARLTALGDRLYFSATEESSGREPWTLPLVGPGSCQPSPTRLCLNGGRFAVEARWRDFQGNVGAGQAVALTADTGYFWFFSPGNVEAVVKVLDGRGLNNHFWVFYGALSSVEYTLVVTDTATGLSRQYYNPPGQLASVGDTRGFGPLGAFSRTGPATAGPAPLALVSERIDPAAAGTPCEPSARRLCLRNGRFAVETAWKDFQGHTGNGTAVSLSTDTGWFWFFDDDNVEVIVKVLDGTPVNGKHWVFYGALSNVEYTVTVTDTQTGKIKTYRNPSGRFASLADTSAF